MNSDMASVVAIEMNLIQKIRAKLLACVQLTKPRIVLLFALTGLAAMLIAKVKLGVWSAKSAVYTSKLDDPFSFWMVLLGIILTAGSANALNQYIDRDIDAIMERTRIKRPIPSGRLSAESALVFSLVTGTLATVLLGYYGNSLAAFFGVFTIAFYIGIYTLWLKRSTPYNIVIGGAAGATAPLIGWAAATGSISWGAFFMFLIIFLWTPPHFWALALCVKDEYAEASVPMLPVVKGVAHTQKQIFLYTLIMLPFTIALFFTGDCGYFYLTASILLGAIFLQRAYALYQHASDSNAWRLFGYSIVYLLTLFLVIMLDLQVQKWFAFTVGPFA